MRSLVCNRPGALAIEDRPRPLPKEGEVVVRIRRAGVCGTDLHIFQGSRGTISFPDPEFHKRETTLMGSRNATPEDFSKIFDAMREGRVPTDALVTHRSALEEAPGGFPLWIKPEAGVIKALIEI